MERNKKLLLGALTAILIIIAIVAVISINSHSIDLSNGTVIQNNSIKNPDLNNKTNGSSNEKITKQEAIFIAKLNSDNHEIWFEDDWNTNVSLSSDGKYWIVKLTNDDPEYYEDHVVLVKVKNGSSKVDGGRWRSFDEIKALFVTQLYAGDADPRFERPKLVTLDGKQVWRTYYYEGGFSRDDGCYVYFDPVTGKSKVDGEKWETLKELDKDINDMYDFGPTPYRDVLRDLYPE